MAERSDDWQERFDQARQDYHGSIEEEQELADAEFQEILDDLDLKEILLEISTDLKSVKRNVAVLVVGLVAIPWVVGLVWGMWLASAT